MPGLCIREEERKEQRSPLPHRDLPRRMLAAVKDRVNMDRRLAKNAKGRARLQEANEILGILRNVIEAYEKL